jgi:aspartyl-tRNA(Asn)/glutamyl-tRNA(Gln) amidotransferase subunit C
MSINITQLAKLANVKLSQKQVEEFSESITTVIAYMDEIKNLALEDVAETSRVTTEINVFREDSIEPSLSQEEALKNAKKTYNGFFVVPYIFDSNDE